MTDEALTLVIDTNEYSGNFERELFTYIFGLEDTPEGATRDLTYYQKAAEIAEASGRMPEDFEDLLEARINDSDDVPHHSYVMIHTTPGFFNDGHGKHLEDTEKNRKRHPKRWPAFQSIAIFLQRLPTPEELTYIKTRAKQFSELPKRHDWDSRPKITGFRLMRTTTAQVSEAL